MDEKGLSRRNFFKRGVSKLTKAGFDMVEHRVEKKAQHWIRPPFARPELDFLLACTRCNACVEACAYNVIFTLPIERGAEVAGTPVLDLVNKGCHLCSDWPCVQACGDEALRLFTDDSEQASDQDNPLALGPCPAPDQCKSIDKAPDTDNTENTGGTTNTYSVTTSDNTVMPQKLANLTVDTERCLPYNGPECGACKGSCPVEGALQWRNEKPVIDNDVCLGCALCREACIVAPSAINLSVVS